ncbi:deoxyribonuclease [Azorhizobium oxalatiphilum]|uniref:diguanylate cyclase n=2 Tax=Azorhizobium oxalatiphilum TaxID=980631 RepID=A0A917C3Y5_9HYPH|nr:deoxyribonuclease [Azorhizobium oxalatiphilum]
MMREAAKSRGFLLAVLIGVTLSLCVEAYLLWQIREERWARAVRAAQNVQRTLGANIDRNLLVVDLSLSGLQDALEHHDLSGLSPQMRNMLLFDRAANAEYLGSMLVLSPSGDVVYDSGALQARQANLSDRDYFKAQIDRQGHTFLSRPFASRLRAGDPSIALSRRITLPDGGFGGVALGVIRLAFFQDMFAHIDLGRGSIISLIRTDGRMLMRFPSTDGKGNVDLDLSGSPSFRRMISGPVEYFSATAAVDGVERHYVYDRVGNFPLVLSVGFSVDEVLRDWRRQATLMMAVGVAISGLLVALALTLQSALRREIRIKGEMATLAATDSLTGLPNRRHFEEALGKEWLRAARGGERLSLLVIDVDHFKTVNDRFGHGVGDALLKVIGTAIQASVQRGADLVARYGGEEFAVLLPAAGEADAQAVAERIRLAIAGASCPDGAGGQVRATVSVGICSMAANGRSQLNDLFRLADQALYLAKADGRNRTRALAAAATG